MQAENDLSPVAPINNFQCYWGACYLIRSVIFSLFLGSIVGALLFLYPFLNSGGDWDLLTAALLLIPFAATLFVNGIWTLVILVCGMALPLKVMRNNRLSVPAMTVLCGTMGTIISAALWAAVMPHGSYEMIWSSVVLRIWFGSGFVFGGLFGWRYARLTPTN